MFVGSNCKYPTLRAPHNHDHRCPVVVNVEFHLLSYDKLNIWSPLRGTMSSGKYSISPSLDISSLDEELASEQCALIIFVADDQILHKLASDGQMD